MSMSEGSFTVKEILVDVVIPKLDDIERKLEHKADLKDLERMELRVDALTVAVAEMPHVKRALEELKSEVAEAKRTFVSRDRAEVLVEQGLRGSQLRGWTAREKMVGGVASLAAAFAAILSALNLFGHGGG